MTKTKTLFLTVLLSSSPHVMAGGSLQHFGNSVDHSAQALAHGSIATIKLVSGVIAIPLMGAGEIGKISAQAGEELWQESQTPLPLTEDILTVGPSPAEAMRTEESE